MEGRVQGSTLDRSFDSVVKSWVFKAEHSYKRNPKLLAQLRYCEEQGIPLVVILGESEIERGVVKLRDVVTRAEVELPLSELAGEVTKRLQAARSNSSS